MKKLIIVIIVILAVGIVVGGFLIWLIQQPQQSKIIHTNIVKNYSMLKDEVYTQHLLKQYWNNETLKELTNGRLNYDKYLDIFYCNGREIEPIKYLSYSPGRNVEGGWYTDFVINCESTYWVFRKMGPGNIGPLFGPFNK